MKIFIGADHRGFSLKEDIKIYLLSKGYVVADMGAHTLDLNDDYPDIAFQVAEEVSKNILENRGILVCGSASGMDIVANKVKGIRATIAYSKNNIFHARQDDDVTVISLAGDVLKDHEAQEIVETFLTTPFKNEERYARRLQQISNIENKVFRD